MSDIECACQMIRVVWKYRVPIQDYFILEIPKLFKILKFCLQNGVPTLWIAVDPDSGKKPVSFLVLGTGQYLQEHLSATYVDSVLMNDDSLVWHLFKIDDEVTDE